MTLEFLVPDMTCGHCVKSITSAVQAVEPSARVQADLASHRVTVSGTSRVEQVRQAIQDAGYETQPA